MTNDLFQTDVSLNQEALDMWIAYRKEIKKPLKAMSIEGVVKKLVKLSEGDYEKQMQIVEESISNGWQGLFALKQQEKPKDNRKSFTELFNTLDMNQ